ncbi:MAG: periplasmic heavy metal sensor [Candidatus Krumholzibacteria bacterium]|nr:periplasmic heavy metal sensor [Candidatus Krumholzibacteria bacterium]
MKRFAVVLTAVALVLTAASIATAQKKCEGAGETVMSPLDPEVKTAVQKLALQYKLDTVDLKAAQMKLHEKMAEELMKDDPSAKALDDIYKEMSALRAKMHAATVAHLLAVKKVLPRDHWAAYLKKHHEAGGCGMGGGCMHEGMKKGCCEHGAACTKGGCCAHGADGCAPKAPAGSAGCGSSAGVAGCATPCVRIGK